VVFDPEEARRLTNLGATADKVEQLQYLQGQAPPGTGKFWEGYDSEAAYWAADRKRAELKNEFAREGTPAGPPKILYPAARDAFFEQEGQLIRFKTNDPRPEGSKLIKIDDINYYWVPPHGYTSAWQNEVIRSIMDPRYERPELPTAGLPMAPPITVTGQQVGVMPMSPATPPGPPVSMRPRVETLGASPAVPPGPPSSMRAPAVSAPADSRRAVSQQQYDEILRRAKASGYSEEEARRLANEKVVVR